jgi:glycosyltransferase involved in cell wall biosynthesis
MIHEKFPQDFPASDATRSHKASAVERADHIICISENTRKDLLDILNPHESKVSVVHLACDVLPTEDAAVPDLVSAGPFLLFVGNRNRYKNFSALLDVIASSLQLRAQIRIICFGGGPINGHERTSLLKHGLSEHSIVFTDGDDAQLATLYRRALALVCTSTYEGFGIPVLEAMSQGCPVICARTSSLPEVAGSAAEYFDPFDNDSLRQAIGKVVESNARRRELAQAGRVRSQQFSWQKCASETHRIYESLV